MFPKLLHLLARIALLQCLAAFLHLKILVAKGFLSFDSVAFFPVYLLVFPTNLHTLCPILTLMYFNYVNHHVLFHFSAYF